MSRRRVSLTVVVPAVLLAVAGLGGVVIVMPGRGVEVRSEQEPGPAPPPADRVSVAPPVAIQDPFGRLFAEGVAYLRQGRGHEAVIVFDAATRQRPHLPEAWTNLGFAHLAQREFEAAKDAFEKAIELRTNQMNAYYGLAVAFEGMGDLDAAVGAMRSYAHLTPEDAPHSRHALGALWEWEEALRERREAANAAPPDPEEDER